MSIFSNKTTAKRPVPEIADTAELIQFDQCYKGFILTKSGDMVAVCEMMPTVSSVENYQHNSDLNFSRAIYALPQNRNIQIFQFPIPSKIGGFCDQLAKQTLDWKTLYEKSKESGDSKDTEKYLSRYKASSYIGANVVENSVYSFQRMSLIVISENAAPNGTLNDNSLEKAHNKLTLKVNEIKTIFDHFYLPLNILSGPEAIKYLWYSYNPDNGAESQAERLAKRFYDLVFAGETEVDLDLLSDGHLEDIANDPKKVADFLAPRYFDEKLEYIKFKNKRMVIYFARDFRNRLPSIRRLLGTNAQNGNRLFLSFYLNTLQADLAAKHIRDLESNKKAVQNLASDFGMARSFVAERQIGAIEEAREGAETEENVPLLLGLYIAYLVDDDDAAMRKQVKAFETTMSTAGINFVPMERNMLEAWKTMMPLSQRSVFPGDDRPVYADNMAEMNPSVTKPWLDDKGVFTGYTTATDGSMSPVVINRARGMAIIPSEAFVGNQGSGKSFTIKFLITNWLVQGHKVIVIDPSNEYIDLVKAYSGSSVDIQDGAGFNMFNFDLMFSGEDRKRYSELVYGDNIAALDSLYEVILGYSDMPGKLKLRTAFQEAMKRKGMGINDESSWEGKEIFLEDVYHELQNLFEADPHTVGLVMAALKDYATKEGPYFNKFNNSFELNFENELAVFSLGMSRFSRNRQEKILGYHFAMRLAYQYAIKAYLSDARSTPIHIVLDEASQVLVTASLVSSVVDMLSFLGKNNISVHLAFQDMNAIANADKLIDADATPESENTLRAVLPAYYLFRQPLPSARVAGRDLGLSDYEIELLTKLNRQALLVFPFNKNKILLDIHVPIEFHDIFDTRPEAQKARAMRSAG